MQHTGVAIESLQSTDAPNTPSRQDVHRMFDRISRRYDLLNRIFSFGQDVVWRKKLARMLSESGAKDVLDLATGTADVLLSAFKFNTSMQTGVGLDMSEGMLQVGNHKVSESELSDKTVLIKADALSIPSPDSSFDATTIAFGIRNVMDVEKSLIEMRRVLNSGGKSFILEFALPTNSILRKLFLFYLRNFIPIIGGYFSGNRSAYKYLNKTVETFPYGKDFAALMEKTGFKDIQIYRMTFGVAIIYEGTK